MAEGHLGPFRSSLSFPMMWSHLGTFFSLSQGSGPPAAGRASTVGGALVVGGATHPFHLFLEDCSCCKGSLLGIPCKCHHLLLGPLVGSGRSCVRIRPGIINWQLHLLPHLLCGWLLKSEVLLYGIRNLLMKLFCHLLLTPALGGQPMMLVDIMVQGFDVLMP